MIAEGTSRVCLRDPGATRVSRPGSLRVTALALLSAFALAFLIPDTVHAQSTKTVDQLTSDLVSLLAAYQTATDATERARVLADVASAAGVRRARLSKLVENDPAAVLRIAVPKKHRDALPLAVQALIEHEEQIEGELEVHFEDGPRRARVHYHLLTRGRRLALHFATRPPRLVSGTRVRVKGVRVGDALALKGSGSVKVLALASSNTFGEQRTMVLLVNFQDSPIEPYPVAYAQDVVFSQTSTFYRESSFQQTWLGGDVFGWFTLPVSVNLCDVNAIGTAAKEAAQAALVDVNSYQRWVFAFPQNACPWLGFASLGGGTVGGSPSKAWINGPLNLKVAAHELGHGFALFHAHAVGCGDGTTGIDFHSGCFTLEYGDTIDNMGFASGYWGAFSKEQIGWLNHGASPPMTMVQSPGGTYWIDTYQTDNLNPKALKIDRGDGSFFYVESRQAIGADAFLAGTPQALNGVFVRIATPGMGDSGVLYDMTPVTTPWVFTDGALVVGQTLTDAASGVGITPLSVGVAGAVVMVSYGSAPTPCTSETPVVAVSPSQASIMPGSSISLMVSVTNRNGAGCTASNFALAGGCRVRLDGESGRDRADAHPGSDCVYDAGGECASVCGSGIVPRLGRWYRKQQSQ